MAAEDIEVVTVVGVLPDILPVEHEILAERLFQASVELITKAWCQRCERGRDAGETAQKPWATVMIALTTGLAHPVPERIRFSLNGLSMVRA